jgi:hypothetical protein
MRLMKLALMASLALAPIVLTVGHATEGSDTPAGVSPPPPAQPRLADAPEQVGRSFRQVGDSVEHGAKTFGRAVEEGARQVGRSFEDGWRSFKRGLNGD